MEPLSTLVPLPSGGCSWEEDLDRILGAEELVGALSRDIGVWVLNISASGCLLESATRVDMGSIGVLTMSRNGQQYTDDVRINRCSPVAGGSGRYLVGAQFLWTRIPGERSLRLVVRKLKTEDDRRQQFRLAGIEAP